VTDSAASISAGLIHCELARLGTAERAEREKAYLKSDLPHVGVTVPHTRAIAVRVLRERGPIEHDCSVALALELWDRPVFECRSAAVEVLDRSSRVLGPADLAVLEGMLREAGTWALVDGLAGRVAAGIVATAGEDPAVDATLHRWVVDDLFWVRRAALLAHLQVLRAGEDEHGIDRFLDDADRLVDEREFFIRKAIGWCMRDLGKRRPELVQRWLTEHLDGLSGVTLREAVKPLSPDQRLALGLDDRGRRTRA
jgi:3-methyladenine DNA glycosylase AlkD